MTERYIWVSKPLMVDPKTKLLRPVKKGQSLVLGRNADKRAKRAAKRALRK